jgi:hypothetical protein
VHLLVFSRILLLEILSVKGLTARRLYKSIGVEGLTRSLYECAETTYVIIILDAIHMGDLHEFP